MDRINKMKKLLADAKEAGSIVGIQFLKKDGSKRVMSFRNGISKGVKGTAPEATARRHTTLNENNMLAVYEMKKGVGQFRTVNLNTCNKIRAMGRTHWF